MEVGRVPMTLTAAAGVAAGVAAVVQTAKPHVLEEAERGHRVKGTQGEVWALVRESFKGIPMPKACVTQ